jgi:hypothetical protein
MNMVSGAPASTLHHEVPLRRGAKAMQVVSEPAAWWHITGAHLTFLDILPLCKSEKRFYLFKSLLFQGFLLHCYLGKECSIREKRKSKDPPQGSSTSSDFKELIKVAIAE